MTDPTKKLFEAKGIHIPVDLDSLELKPCRWFCGASLLLVPTPGWEPKVLALGPHERVHGQFAEETYEGAKGLRYVGHSLEATGGIRFQSHWCAMKMRACRTCRETIRIGLCPPEIDEPGVSSLRFLEWAPQEGGILVIDEDGYVTVNKQTLVGYMPHSCRWDNRHDQAQSD